jgi:hypothetical protein
MGGITIDVGRRVRITGPEGQLRGVIEPGRQRLDGYHALWYARSRVDTNDYDRMARQRCVMAAMLHQLDPATVLVKFREIARAGEQLISTDIPPGELDTLASLALKARHGTVTSVQFVPPLIKTARPDFDLIKEKVQEALAVSASPSPSAGEVEDDTDQTGTSAAGGDPGASSSSAGSDGGTSGGADAGSGEAGGADEEDEPPAVTELDQACAAG